MKTDFWKIVPLGMVLFLAGEMVATAQSTTGPKAVRVPVSGTFAGGGQFSGIVTINRFEQQENEIVAVGFVSGVLSRGSRALGTALAGEVTWPITVKSSATQKTSSIGPAQTSCPVLSIALGPVDVNLLGFQVSLGAATLDIGGESGTPLGDLVCSISSLLGNVAAVVNLLNSLLSLLTGLLGGILPAA